MSKYFTIFLLFISSFSFATVQIKDVFKVGDAYYSINELPLLQLYNHGELSSILHQEPCSASWRGYEAHWELKENFLWLTRMEKNPCNNKYENIEADLLFEGQEYPIKAEWYTGKIILPVAEKKYVTREGFDEDNIQDGGLLGYDLEAFVFNFVEGRLESKGVEIIQKRN